MRLVIAYLRLLVFFTFSAVMLTATGIAAAVKPGTPAYWGPAEIWIRGILRIFGVNLVVTGRERLDPDRTYVVMANHRSQLDPVAMGVAMLPRYTRWVAKKELRRVPILGTALELTGQIFIDRGDTSSAVNALARHAGDRDALICFFPEGHRSSTREMLPFKKGAAAFAISARVWVLPMAVSGSERVIANHSIMSTPGTIRVALGTPIDTSGMTEDDRGSLTERVRAQIQSMLFELEGPPPPSEKSWQRKPPLAMSSATEDKEAPASSSPAQPARAS
ncbi:MAG: lysophospholipid acyltransferase family protein [Candidatus Binatia bacterium]